MFAVPSAPAYAYMDSASNPPTPSSSDASTFERWRRKFSMITGVGGTKDERAAEMDANHHTTCEKWKRELMTYSQYRRIHAPWDVDTSRTQGRGLPHRFLQVRPWYS